jgi:hypothetical protein
MEKIINNKVLGSFEIVRYNFEILNGEPKIIIHQIKALDKDGKYIKFVKLKDFEKELSLYPVKFK